MKEFKYKVGGAYINQKIILDNNNILKKMLNNIKNVNILKDFLESILEIKILKIIFRPSLKKESNSFYVQDICCLKVFTEKEKINVGIQIVNGYYIENKILLYCANIYKNLNDIKLEKILTINILDFNYLKSEKYHNIISLVKDNIQNEIFEIHILELPKFKITNNKNISKKEAWLAFLKGEEKIVDFNNKKYKQIERLNNLLNNYWKSEIL